MDLELRGKACLVTGAGEGMGRASALTLAREGARVAVVARSRDALEQVATDAERAGAADVLVLDADLFDSDSARAVVSRTVESFGGVDVLVNTVGLCEPVRGGILDQDDEYWRRAHEGVLLVNVRLCREVVAWMRAHGGGAIVNVSATSVRHHVPMLAHYSAAKAALAHFTRTCAKEFAPDGIRVNGVLPGMIASESVRRRHVTRLERTGWSEQELFADSNRRYGGLTWWDRYGETDEVADVVAFLASARASYVNGALVPVDGGSG